MPVFRCHNEKCRTDPAKRKFLEFEATDPLCPSCGCDGREQKYADTVVQLEVIHFDPPDERLVGKGKNYLACNPKRHVGGKMATGVPSSVNCPKCKETDEFKAAVAKESDGETDMRTAMVQGLMDRGLLKPEPEGCCG